MQLCRPENDRREAVREWQPDFANAYYSRGVAYQEQATRQIRIRNSGGGWRGRVETASLLPSFQLYERLLEFLAT